MGPALVRWLAAAAAVRGRSHGQRKEACQDYVRQVVTRSFCGVALADGAGSAAHGGKGAAVAAASTLQFLVAQFSDLLDAGMHSAGCRVVGACVAAMEGAARDAGIPLRQMATTLLVAAVSRGRFFVGQIGDGVIGREQQGQVRPVFAPHRGEFYNETKFVTDPDASESFSVEMGPASDIQGFILMSDGSAESLFSRRESALAPACATMLSWLDSARPRDVDRALGRSLRKRLRPRTTDDCSIAVLRRVTDSLETLTTRPPEFQRSFLDLRSTQGLATRLRVLRLLSASAADLSDDCVPADSHVTRATLRRHRGALQELFANGPPVPQTGRIPH